MVNKKLIYISNAASSVFESQVLTYLDWLYENNVFEEICLFIGTKTASSIKRRRLEEREYDIIEFFDPPAYTLFNEMLYRSLFRQLKKKNLRNTVIHIRSEKYAQAVHRYRTKYQIDCKIFTDIRGAVLEETLDYKDFNFLLKKLKKNYFFQKRNELKNQTDLVSVVSPKLKEYVHKHYNIEKSRIFVNHSFASEYFCYDEEYRNAYRKKLNIGEDEIVFIFSTGGNSSWQNTEAIINSINQSGYKIINLSNKEIQGKNIINLYVPHQEVPKYLCAADIGVIWRNDDVVNNVASPVKFSEYVSCGLPIITNNGVRLISSYVQKTGFGRTLNSIHAISESLVGELLKLDRSEISNYSKSRFHITGVIDGYLKMYNECITNEV